MYNAHQPYMLTISLVGTNLVSVHVGHSNMMVLSFHSTECQGMELWMHWMVAKGLELLVVIGVGDEFEDGLTGAVVVSEESIGNAQLELSLQE